MCRYSSMLDWILPSLIFLFGFLFCELFSFVLFFHDCLFLLTCRFGGIFFFNKCWLLSLFGDTLHLFPSCGLAFGMRRARTGALWSWAFCSVAMEEVQHHLQTVSAVLLLLLWVFELFFLKSFLCCANNVLATYCPFTVSVSWYVTCF